MSSFRIVEHTFEGAHIREYPQAISTYQEDVIQLSAKQYIPLNSTPQSGDITIIATHASAFPKELYEPLWDDLLAQSKAAGYGIRGIWMADVANQGGSYLLNEAKTGNDPNFADHSRDLLAMINCFRREMTRPIFGIGHSMGCSSLVSLSHMHPRLLTSLILIDAVITSQASNALWPMLKLPSFRKDYWPTRAHAETTFRKNPMVKRFDPRVIENILTHSIRPTPTLLHPETAKDGCKEQAYTLTTPKHQEAVSIARPNYADIAVLDDASVEQRHSHPDIWDSAPYKSPFYKSEGRTCWMFLPHLRPSVLWLYGGDSYAAIPSEREAKLERTGTEWNGSGGARLGRVKEVLVQGSGHFVCLEKVRECAGEISAYLDDEVGVWRRGEQTSVDCEWREKDVVGRQMLDGRWYDNVKDWKGQRKVDSKL